MSLYPMYARPRNLEQAVELLSGLNNGVVVIAGGQEIMPVINYGIMMPEVYVDIGGINTLKGITVDGGEVSIGALTVHRDVQASPHILEHLPLLAYSAQQIGGGWQVHNRGTIGGNIVSMHPLYDIAPALLALNADVEMASERGVTRVCFSELIKDSSHGLGSDAILSRVLAKSMKPNSYWGYQKLKNTAGAYASANAAVVLEVEGETITSIRVVIGAVADQLTLVTQSLDVCIGQGYSAALGVEIEKICSAAIREPLDDHQGHASWRRAMAGLVARRAVEHAITKLIPSTDLESES